MTETSTIVTPLIKALNALPGCIAYRVHSGTVKVRGAWMRLAEPGYPDVAAIVRGTPCFFEAKIAKTKSGGVHFEPEQLDMHHRLRRAGARVEVVRSVAEAMTVVRQILANPASGVVAQSVENKSAAHELRAHAPPVPVSGENDEVR